MGFVTFILVLVLGFGALRAFGRWGERWGSTPQEFEASLPGDEWLAGGSRHHVRMTRAIWIDAPRDEVWPWLAQMGRGAGWYSYDRLDNGGRPSARHLVSWIPDPALGDASTVGYLRHVDTGHDLAWWLDGVRFFGAVFRSVMTYRVDDHGDRCRLLVRMQADTTGFLGPFAGWMFRIIDTIMARRQLLGIRERAERYGARTEDPELPETGARDQYQLYHVIFASGQEAGVAGTESARRWRQAAIDDGVVIDKPPTR